jgi:hypothetical protein
MIKHAWVLTAVLAMLLSAGTVPAADDVKILGVKFPVEKVVAGKTLKLNGVAYRKAMGFIKVYAVGLYLEHPTKEPGEVINSEQVKQLYFHYLTSRATAQKLREGYLILMQKCNPPDLYERNIQDVERYAAWLDKDMQPGLTSISTYVPGKGLTLEYQGEERGTIANPEFIQMYYTYNFGEKAKAKIRDGLLGKK